MNFYKEKDSLKKCHGQHLARSSTFSSSEYSSLVKSLGKSIYIGLGSPDNSQSVKLPGVRSTLCLERRICIKSAQEQGYGLAHGVVNYKDTKRKCRHLKRLTCNGTLRQVFIRDYRLEKQSVMLVFSAQLCELMPI